MKNTPLIYRKQAVLELLGVSDSTLRRWIADADFPAARQLGPRAVGWSAADVTTWLDSRPYVGKISRIPAKPDARAGAELCFLRRSTS